jgi:4-amino-4-deoxy-L-arabinose transferase-like glycosyltransferase
VALAALTVLTLLRLAIAASVPLIPDEAYYWVWSRGLAAGYPDHPPMVAIWIRLGTIVAGDGPLGVRLLSPLSVAIASLLLADAADHLLPGRGAGIRAAALLNATLLFGVGGILMTPDAPLLAFWIACLWALARLLGSG